MSHKYPYTDDHRPSWTKILSIGATILGGLALLCSVGTIIFAAGSHEGGESGIGNAFAAGYLAIATGLFALPGLIIAIACALTSMIRYRETPTLPNVAALLNVSAILVILWAMMH